MQVLIETRMVLAVLAAGLAWPAAQASPVPAAVDGGGFEGIAPAPYPLGADIRMEGVSLRAHPDRVAVEGQRLDMTAGELTTILRFAPDDDTKVRLEVLQFLPRSTPSVACQEIAITASRGAQVEVFPIIDREGIPGEAYRDRPRR